MVLAKTVLVIHSIGICRLSAQGCVFHWRCPPGPLGLSPVVMVFQCVCQRSLLPSPFDSGDGVPIGWRHAKGLFVVMTVL